MSLKINNTLFNTLDKALQYIEDNQLDIENIDRIHVEFINDVTLVNTRIISPENHQNAIYSYIDEDDVEYETARLELTITTQYHNWRNTVADELYTQLINYELGEVNEVDQDVIDAYNKCVDAHNKYSNLEYVTHKTTANELRSRII